MQPNLLNTRQLQTRQLNDQPLPVDHCGSEFSSLIPTLEASANDAVACIKHINKVFTYDDILSGNGIGDRLSEAHVTDHCDMSVSYSIIAR